MPSVTSEFYHKRIASQPRGIPLEEATGAFGPVWIHENKSGPVISTSWFESQTLCAEGYDVSELGSDVVLVDAPGFEDTRGDEFSMVTSLSLDRAFDSVACISAILLLVPYSLISETRGRGLLELLGKLRGMLKQIFDGRPGIVLYIIITKYEGDVGQRAEMEDGAFATEASRHCGKNLRTAGSESRPLDEHCILWRAVKHSASQKRIHVLDLEDLGQRADLLDALDALSQSHGPCSKPDFGSSFHDTKSQRTVELMFSTAAHTWSMFFKQFLQENPRLMNEIKEEICDVQSEIQEVESSDETRHQHHQALMEQLGQQSKEELSRNGHTPNNHLIDEAEAAIANRSVAECKDRLQKQRAHLQHASDRTAELKKNITMREAEIDQLKKGHEDIDVFKTDYNSIDRVLLFDRDCGNDTLEAALQDVRPWDYSQCSGERNQTVANYSGGVYKYVYLPKEYRLIPADEDQRKRFETSLLDGESFGQTTARVSGDKYTLQGRKASVDGRTVAYLFTFNFDANKPYPSVWVVHSIPNADYNEAKISNAESDMNSLVHQLDQASKMENTQKALVDILKKECDAKALFEESSLNFTAEQKKLQQLNSTLRQSFFEFAREHAWLAFTILGYYNTTVPVLVDLAEFVPRVITSEAVNRDALVKELGAFMEAYHEANKTGILLKAENVLAEYRKGNSISC